MNKNQKPKLKQKEAKESPPNLGLNNDKLLFISSGESGIPALKRTGMPALPTQLVRYRKRLRSEGRQKEAINKMGVHFFAEDRDIEVVWSRPHKPLPYLSKFKSVLTPDFSLYRDWPRVMQMWNVYRSRWVGCFWQFKGFQVIPTVSWSNQTSWEFAFEGIAKGSLVAVSAIGVSRQDMTQMQMFTDGFKEMVAQLDPCGVIVSGGLPKGCEGVVRSYPFTSLWEDARLHLKEKGEEKR
jgi:hypothetical protein